ADLKMKGERKILQAGDPAKAIAERIREGDLLLMGTSKGGTIEKLLFKSVPEDVAQLSSAPMIIFKRFQPRRKWWLERLITGKKAVVK
ncbi:MAG: universal stress protein, partial [Candidatus Zixiibacteriota bacterium]